MSILVGYATRYGGTHGIAERIARRLTEGGHQAEVRPIKEVADLEGYHACVIGSAAYFGSWLKEASEFVRRHQSALRARPLWLFSSGPRGNEKTDAQGQDKLVAAEPKQFAEFRKIVEPRGTRVFFGALDLSRLRLFDRLVTRMPAVRTADLFPEGDFRDWAAIDAWADAIAREIAPVPAAIR